MLTFFDDRYQQKGLRFEFTHNECNESSFSNNESNYSKTYCQYVGQHYLDNIIMSNDHNYRRVTYNSNSIMDVDFI